MKVLVIGDSPFLSTGFARVNRVAAKAFADAGYDIGVVSGLSMDPVEDDLGYTMFYPEQGDVMGMLALPEAIKSFEPDIIYATGEPGMITAYARMTPASLPFLAYIPIEGEPIVNQEWKAVLSGLHVITCSEYGAEVIARDCKIDKPKWVYHGVDTEVFRVNGRRDEVRAMLNWTDKYVLMTVGANVRRKQHPRLFEALALLKHHYKQNDIILYDHTIPFDGYWLEGWNLPEISHAMGVHQEVVFNPSVIKHGDSIPDVGLYDGLGLVDLYNAADLFVLPSQVEGFGLPIAEAMACGLPVMVTKYAAGWEVARPAGIGIPVKDWETHKSGTRYANVDVEALAKEILRARRNPRGQGQRVAAGLRRVRDFRWEAFTETIIGSAQAILSTPKGEGVEAISDQRRPKNQGEDARPKEGDPTYPADSVEAKNSPSQAQAGSYEEGARASGVSDRSQEPSPSAS